MNVSFKKRVQEVLGYLDPGQAAWTGHPPWDPHCAPGGACGTWRRTRVREGGGWEPGAW
jgi:hypothetical protein